MLIKDLIEIPDTVNQGDFVLRLTEGITDPDATICQYQVTPNLAAKTKTCWHRIEIKLPVE